MNGKSKLVVPVIAIMMCAVALAGVAYAATTTVSNNGGMAPPSVYTIDLYNVADGTTIQSEAYTVSGFTFYTQKVVNGTLNVLVDPADSAVIGYVGVKDATGFVAATITASMNTASGYSGPFVQDGNNLEATIDGTVVTISASVVDGTTTNVKAIKLTITTSGDSSLTDANLAAKGVANAVDALEFTLTFSATSA